MAIAAPPNSDRGTTIELNGQGFQVVGVVGGKADVGAADEQNFLLDVPAVYADCSGGLGATERHIPGMYSWGRFIDTFSCPGVVLPAGKLIEIMPDEEKFQFGLQASWVMGSDLYLGVGRHIKKIAGMTGTTWTHFYDTGPGVSVWSVKKFNGKVAVGTATTGFFSVDKLTVIDESTLAVNTYASVLRMNLATVTWAPTGTPRETIVGNPDGSTLRYCTGDITVDANWVPAAGSPIPVGNSSYTIFTIAGAPRHVYVGTTGGLRDINAYGETPNLTPYWENSFDINSGQTVMVMDDHIYTNHGFGAERIPITGERQDIPEQYQPGIGLPFTGPMQGRITRQCVWGNGWGIAAIANVGLNESYICMFKDKLKAGVDVPGPVVWHGAYAVIPGTCSHLNVISPPGGQPFLLIGGVDSITNEVKVYRQSLPQAPNSLQALRTGEAHEFASEAKIYFADGWMEYITGNRAASRFDIVAAEMTGTPIITVSANIDDADTSTAANVSYDEFGKAYERWGSSRRNGRVSRRTRRTWPSAATLKFLVTLTGSATSPAVFKALRVRADINFENPDVRTYVLDLRNSQETLAGTIELKGALARLNMLKQLVSLRSTQVAMIDEFNETWQVSVLQIAWEEKGLTSSDWGITASIQVRFLYRTGVTYRGGYNYNELNPWGGAA